MKRCGGPSCESLVNMKGCRYVRLQDKLFCSSVCATAWLDSRQIHVVAEEPKLPVIHVKINT